MKSKILSVLRHSDDYVSGEDLSRCLGVTRTAVWKNINLLKDEGYNIHSVRNKGYKLESSPDLLDKELIIDKLSPSVIGTKIEILKTIDSTNEEVKRWASRGEASGLVIGAEEQTAGKGRFGRLWKSDNGGLYFSVLLRPELPPSEIAAITLAAGFAVCNAVRDYTNCDAQIKWPNDIIIGNKKICGILTEMAAQSDRLDYVVIGIGINVNHCTFPDEIQHKATSLFLETNQKTDRNDFFAAVLKSLDTVMQSFLVSLSIDDVNRFKELCATLGRNVSLERSGTVIQGIAEDINLSGELIINSNGKKITVNSGEVTVQGIY